jgi:hypothetical protein
MARNPNGVTTIPILQHVNPRFVLRPRASYNLDRKLYLIGKLKQVLKKRYGRSNVLPQMNNGIGLPMNSWYAGLFGLNLS